MSKGVDINIVEKLLLLFRAHFPYIGGRQTGGWKFKMEDDKKFTIECRNGTKNYITPDSCRTLLEIWNKDNPNFKLKEKNRYCIEDEEVWTWIIWKLELEND